MKSIFFCLLFVVGSFFGFGNDAQGATVSVFVPGSANPYLAGMPNGTTAPGGDSAPGQSPLLVTGLNISQTNYLSFSATGSASYNFQVSTVLMAVYTSDHFFQEVLKMVSPAYVSPFQHLSVFF